MPDWTPALINPDVNRSEAISIGWVLTSGALFSTRISAIGAGVVPDPGNLSTFRESVGEISNAGVIRMTEERSTFIAAINANVFDEAYNDGTVAVFTMQNNNGQLLSFEIPNPDASIFTADGVTVDLANTAVAAMVTAVQILVNNSFDIANSYAVTRGVLRSRKVNFGRGARPRPAISEPGVADNPPDAPGV